MLITSSVFIPSRKKLAGNLPLVLCLAIAIVSAPMVSVCSADQQYEDCVNMRWAQCAATADSMVHSAIDLANYASNANAAWKNTATANCNGNPVCIDQVKAQYDLQQTAISLALAAALYAIDAYFYYCLWSAMRDCPFTG